MPALTLPVYIDQVYHGLVHQGVPVDIDALPVVIENEIAAIRLTALAELVKQQPEVDANLRRQYNANLNASGQVTLTGNDLNGFPMDNILLGDIVKHITTVAGGTSIWPIQWLNHSQDLVSPPNLPDFAFAYNGTGRVISVVDYTGAPITGNPILTWRAQFIPVLADITMPEVQTILVDLLIKALTPGGSGSPEEKAAEPFIAGAGP